MAYIGVAKPIMASLVSEEEKKYGYGFRFGKAIKVEITPEYEDESEYGDINDTEESESFAYAEVKLTTSEIPDEAEETVFGHTRNGNGTTYNDKDRGGYVGMGFRTREVVKGQTKYVAIWMFKVKFKETGQPHDTRGENIDYNTPEFSGKAYPLENGEWKKKERFNTAQEADSWLNKMAGISEEE